MGMKKIINDPSNFVDEVLNGVLVAHPEYYRLAGPSRRAIIASCSPTPGRVGIITGGGSGHLPLFLGYVGVGLASGVAVGNVFSSPSPVQILEATRAVSGGAGVLYLYGNYGGDVYNFDIAAEVAAAEGIPTITVLGHDDVYSAPADQAATRRGIAGLVFAYKIAGAAAARGDDLAAVAYLAAAASNATRTAGVGLAPTILPAAGKPTFELADGEMEIGVGIHGESGVAKVPIATAREIADELFGQIQEDTGMGPGDRIAVLINGLGATPLEELYLLYGRVAEQIEAVGATVAQVFIGEYATSLEMAGASVSVLPLNSELESLLTAPAYSPFWRPGSAADRSHRDNSVSGNEKPDRSDALIPLASFESPIRAAALTLVHTMPEHTEELRDLDATLGDGDLGITVSLGLTAMAERIDALPVTVASSALLRELGLAFASANPSTFAALVGMGLVAASGKISDLVPMDRHAALRLGHEIAASIASRGGAQLGDKTMLDVLEPALDALARNPSVNEFATFLTRQVDKVAALQSVRGRAAWHRERSIGHKDPGSVAMAYALAILAGADCTAAPARPKDPCWSTTGKVGHSGNL